MARKPHDSFVEDIPAYVLGALTEAEARALKAHLKTCGQCRAELAHYQQIGDGLLAAVIPTRTPRPDVKRRLLSALDVSRLALPWRRKLRFRQIATAAIALALIGTNLTAFLEIRQLREQQTELLGQVEKNHSILGMLAASTEIHPISSGGLSGNLLLDREKNQAFLLMWNLPPLAEDFVYRIWLITPSGGRVNAGSLHPEDDRPLSSTELAAPGSLADFIGLELTIETQGNSGQPPGEPVLSVEY